MKVDLDKLTRGFLLGESHNKPNVMSYIESVREALENIKPMTKADSSRIDIAKSQMREVRRNFRRMNQRIDRLEEQVKVLEEQKEK